MGRSKIFILADLAVNSYIDPNPKKNLQILTKECLNTLPKFFLSLSPSMLKGCLQKILINKFWTFAVI